MSSGQLQGIDSAIHADPGRTCRRGVDRSSCPSDHYRRIRGEQYPQVPPSASEQSSCYVIGMVKRIGKLVLLLAGAFITIGAVIAGAFMLAGAVAAAAVLLLYASVVVLVRRITRRTGPRPSLTAG